MRIPVRKAWVSRARGPMVAFARPKNSRPNVTFPTLAVGFMPKTHPRLGSGVSAAPAPPDGADASARGGAAPCPPPCGSGWGGSCSRFTTQSPVVVNLHVGVGASGKDCETGQAPEV